MRGRFFGPEIGGRRLVPPLPHGQSATGYFYSNVLFVCVSQTTSGTGGDGGRSDDSSVDGSDDSEDDDGSIWWIILLIVIGILLLILLIILLIILLCTWSATLRFYWSNLKRFYRATLCQRGISCHRVSVRPCVRPSVRPSVTSRSCTKMAKPRITLRTVQDSTGTLVFLCQESWRNSNDITPNWGAKQRWGQVQIKEYLNRGAARVETNGPTGYEQRNLGQMCHALVYRCTRTEPAGSTMPLISLEFSDTES